jgi:hypothetical protein
LVAAVRIKHVHQQPAQVDQPQLRIFVHFVKRRKSARQEEPVVGCTEFIAVSLYGLGTIRVIKPFVPARISSRTASLPRMSHSMRTDWTHSSPAIPLTLMQYS